MTMRQRSVFLMFCLLIFGIPIGLIRSVFHHSLDDNDQRAILQARAHFDEVFSLVISENLRMIDMDFFLHSPAADALQTPEKLGTLKIWKQVINRQLRGLTAFIVLDGKGNPVPELTDLPFPPQLGPRLMTDLRMAARGDESGLKTHLGEYRRFFGPVLARRIGFNFQEGIERLDYRGEFQYGYFSKAFRHGMLIILFRDSPNWDVFIALMRARLLNLQKCGGGAVILDVRRPMEEWRRLFGSSWATLRSVMLDSRNIDGLPVAAGKNLWQVKTIRGPWRLVLFHSDGRDPKGFVARRLIDGFCLAGFLLCSLLAWYMMYGGGQNRLTIRFKLVSLLVYVVCVPLLLLGGTARDFLRERRSLLLQELRLQQEKYLQEFDREYLTGLGNMVKKIRRSIRQPVPFGKDLQSATCDRLMRIQKRYAVVICELVDDHGKSCHHLQGRIEQAARPLIIAVQNATSNILGELNQGAGGLRRETARDQLISATGEMFGFNVEKIIGVIAQKLGDIERIFMARESAQVTLQPVSEPGRPARFLAMIGWHDVVLQPAYIRNRLPPLARRLSTAHFSAVSPSDKNFVFKDEIFNAVSQTIRHRLQTEVLPISVSIEREGREWLMTGLRGTNLTRYFLFMVSDDRMIRSGLVRLLIPYFALSLTLLAVALSVAGILARRFLEPVGNLMTGIEAMQNRLFNQSIPVVHQDELGQLSTAFNEMMEGMKELEVAKIVQDSLFPSIPLSIGNWGIHGSCQAASRIGGDYFDYFVLPDGRLAFVIGDVSGHGTSAALVVAMAKALIAHPESIHEPGPILDLMQGVFLPTLRRKKMMSCFFAVFEPTTGLLKTANAGHNVPYLVRADGRIEQLKSGGKPLGTKNKPFATQEYVLGNEDWLFLYTDGFIEARAVDGADIGYERTEAALPACRRENAIETQTQLRRWQETLSAPGPQADDITVVVLQQDRTSAPR
ncbi:MAG: SpoIIE family protein phosphatase [Candidatus Ozemobacteraceae bacterium]